MIEVEPGLLAYPVSGVTVLLHVRCSGGRARLDAALRAAAAEIAALDGGWRSAPGLAPGDRNGPAYVSRPIALPDGYLLMVDFASTPPALVRTVPQLIARRLEEAGVAQAVIAAAPRMGDRHGAVTGLAPAVRAWLCGPRGRPFGVAPRRPPGWLLRIAVGWLSAHHPPGVAPVGLVVSAELPQDWPTLAEALEPALHTATPVAAVASDFRAAATALAVEGGLLDTAPAAALTAAGDRDLRADLTSMRDLVLAHAAEFVWAGVGVADSARDAYVAGTDVGEVADVLVPDGMWFQLLSEGHLDRLGGRPPGAVRLDGGRFGSGRFGGGRFALTVGEPEQWLPTHPDRDDVAARARALLAGCLAGPGEVLALRRDRLLAARANDTEGLFPPPPR
jgi:hypothetical protein